MTDDDRCEISGDQYGIFKCLIKKRVFGAVLYCDVDEMTAGTCSLCVVLRGKKHPIYPD